MFTALILASVLSASAAQAEAPAADETRFDPAATTFTGWVRVSRGEFQLYPQQRQLREPFSRPCVSGALPRSLQESAASFSGAKVRFTGRAVSWDENRVSGAVRHEGARILNECGGDFVIQATDVTVLR